jgi:hypothetical protein
MPVTSSPSSPTQSSGAMTPYGGAANMAAMMPGIPSFNFGAMPKGAELADSSENIKGLLTRDPTSLTNTIMPYLQSLFGQNSAFLQQMFQQQGAQGASQAQSDAMKRGLTGSSIESAGIQGAYNSANQGYNQAIMQGLSNLGNSFSNASQFDIGQQTDMYRTLASALGQERAQDIQQSQFNRQLEAGLSAADANRHAQMWSSIIGGAGSLGAGALIGFSDIRLKENLEPVGKVGPLTAYSFTFKRGMDLPRGEQRGFLAHEVAAAFPKCVGVKDGYLTVNYGRLRGELCHGR